MTSDRRQLSAGMIATLSAELEGKVAPDLVADIVQAVLDEGRNDTPDRAAIWPFTRSDVVSPFAHRGQDWARMNRSTRCRASSIKDPAARSGVSFGPSSRTAWTMSATRSGATFPVSYTHLTLPTIY